MKGLRKTGVVVLLGGAFAACGPPPPGANYWEQVKREYQSRDYADTLAYLNEVLGIESDYGSRAAAMKITLLGALARADLEVEQACAEGFYYVSERDTPFFKTCAAQYRRQVKVHTLALLEALDEFETLAAGSETVALDFPLPEASVAPNSVIGRIRVGVMAADELFEAAVTRTVDRHIILQAQDLMGASDPKAAQRAFESPPVTVPKAVFLVGVAKTLVAAAAGFESGRLNEPALGAAVLKRARECLDPALAGGEAQAQARELAKEIAGKLR